MFAVVAFTLMKFGIMHGSQVLLGEWYTVSKGLKEAECVLQAEYIDRNDHDYNVYYICVPEEALPTEEEINSK